MPECLIEFCRVTLTFESVDKILWRHCDHSNQSSLPACTFTWYYLFLKMLGNEIWKFGRNLPLATFGKERVKNNRKTKITWDKKLTITQLHAHVIELTGLGPFHYLLHIIISFHSQSKMKATWKSENANDFTSKTTALYNYASMSIVQLLRKTS